MDLVLAMDQSNLNVLQQMRPEAELHDKLLLFRSFDPENNGDLEVPDPYYGDGDGFAQVFDMIEAASGGLLEEIRRTHL